MARIDHDRLPQRASGSLEARFADVMTVLSVMQHEMQIHQRVGRDRFPEDRDLLAIELADLLCRKVDAKHERHTAAQVDGRGDQRFFHRQRDAAVTHDPLLVAERFRQCFAETNAGVFNRVMVIDVQIASRFDGQIHQRVLRQQRQHVIEEADAGVDLRLARAVEIERQVNRGFGGLPVNFSGAWHEEGLGLGVRNQAAPSLSAGFAGSERAFEGVAGVVGFVELFGETGCLPACD